LVTARFSTLAALALGLLAVAVPAAALQAEIARYHHAVRDICRTGVTPAIADAYEQARQAVERAQYGGGRDNNFWGLKTPEGFWLDCLQSPNDGKS
jgi:2-methylisocitrate lyase-like PEP mutase family enzyme